MHKLPRRDEDPILRLFSHYFCAADTMRKNIESLKKERQRKGCLSENKEMDYYHYIKFWLASLYVAAEGFKHINMKDEMPSRPEMFHKLIEKYE